MQQADAAMGEYGTFEFFVFRLDTFYVIFWIIVDETTYNIRLSTFGELAIDLRIE